MTARLGMLTPSSNTVLEPLTAGMTAAIPGVGAHFARFRVTQIGLDAKALGQFDPEPMLQAADLLADARCDVICWNGTSASWLGLDADRALVEQIEERTGCRGATCVLSLVDAFHALDVRKYGLVTPYSEDVQGRIIQNLAGQGFDCVAERHFGLRDNFSFAEVGRETIEQSMRDTAAGGAEAVVVLCTNLDGAALAGKVERETGVPVIDSVAVTVWGALRAVGLPTAPLAPWGPRLATLHELELAGASS